MKDQEHQRPRWEEQQQLSHDGSRRLGASNEADAWIDFLAHSCVEYPLNVRADLTLKQRRASDLDTMRPLDEAINVRVRQRRFSLRDAPRFAPYYYLSDDETRRIAIRIMNRLNGRIFGSSARRRRNPNRLTALVCQHDKDTRRHLHALLAVPPAISGARFEEMWVQALEPEPFAYDWKIEPVETVAGSILYNTNERKSSLKDSIVYLYPQFRRRADETDNA